MSVFSKSRRAGLPRMPEGPAIFVEERRVPSWLVRLGYALAAMQAVIVITVALVAGRGRVQAWELVSGCAVILAGAPLTPLVVSMIRMKTAVLGDRIQIGLFAGPIKLWRHSYIWAAIERCEVLADWNVVGVAVDRSEFLPLAGLRGMIFSQGREGTMLMFGGNGVRLTLRDGRRILIGSRNAEPLATLVREASSVANSA